MKKSKYMRPTDIKVSFHLRLLPSFHRAFKVFAAQNEVTVQGMLEYFMHLAIKDDYRVLEIIDEYKNTRDNVFKEEITEMAAKDILDMIAKSNVLNA